MHSVRRKRSDTPLSFVKRPHFTPCNIQSWQIARIQTSTLRGIHTSKERVLIGRMTSDQKLKASGEGSKWKIYGTLKT